MDQLRAVLGLVASLMLILSSLMHSFAGWTQLSTLLNTALLPTNLIQALALGWHLGGIMMLVSGIVCLQVFYGRWRGKHNPIFAPLVIGLGYLGFFLWALANSGFDQFLLVFLVPALLLIFAATGKPSLKA